MTRFAYVPIALIALCAANGAPAKEPIGELPNLEWMVDEHSIGFAIPNSGVWDLDAHCDGKKVLFETLAPTAKKPARIGGRDGRRMVSTAVKEDYEGNPRASFVSVRGDALHAAATESSWIEISGEGGSYRIADVPNEAFKRLYARCAKRGEKRR